MVAIPPSGMDGTGGPSGSGRCAPGSSRRMTADHNRTHGRDAAVGDTLGPGGRPRNIIDRNSAKNPCHPPTPASRPGGREQFAEQLLRVLVDAAGGEPRANIP